MNLLFNGICDYAFHSCRISPIAVFLVEFFLPSTACIPPYIRYIEEPKAPRYASTKKCLLHPLPLLPTPAPATLKRLVFASPANARHAIAERNRPAVATPRKLVPVKFASALPATVRRITALVTSLRLALATYANAPPASVRRPVPSIALRSALAMSASVKLASARRKNHRHASVTAVSPVLVTPASARLASVKRRAPVIVQRFVPATLASAPHASAVVVRPPSHGTV